MARLLGVILLMCSCCATLRGWERERKEGRREEGRKGETKMKYCYLYKVLAAEQNTVCTSTLPGEKSVAQIQHG